MTCFNDSDRRYMRRALQLAASGRGHTSPNPMVGAVIVAPDGRIIGEGWHRRFGQAHAEVNAVRSVKDSDRALLPQSTIYVTLEPCSHYGKTPPCARLLTDIGIGRVVIAAGDPNPQVSGRGVAMLRQAGIQVDEGLLAAEAWELNRLFMTAHTLHRPFVTLKWAQSADGFMDVRRSPDCTAARFSTPLSAQLVHFRRASHDAIAVGAGTVIADRPALTVRLIEGRSPRVVVFDRSSHLENIDAEILKHDNTIIINTRRPLKDTLGSLYADYGITSLLVEGGPSLLKQFINSGLWDEAYVETAPCTLADKGAAPAPNLTSIARNCLFFGRNFVNFYSHYTVEGVKNI